MEDKLKIYLPKFLSAPSEENLFNCLEDFPHNIDNKFYTNYLKRESTVFQGDGLDELLLVDFSDMSNKPGRGIILSNTCDISHGNSRLFPSQVVYAPIFNLEKYKASISKAESKTADQINNHILSIKKQEISQIFFLPKYDNVIEESIVFLDRVINCSNQKISREDLPENRVFTLSDYGAYIFLLKLSIHFTRIQDNVERKSVS